MHVLSLFVVDQFKYNVKRLELFKIRRHIKCPLLLLSLLLLLLLLIREWQSLPHLEHVKGVVGLLARHAVFYEAFSLLLLLAVFLHIVITPVLLCVCGSNFPSLCLCQVLPSFILEA